jgi:chromatin remodeling complex protein RSC6
VQEERSTRRDVLHVRSSVEVTKKLWDYIKKNKLQDEKKKTLINADDALKAVFGGKKQVTMFEMTRYVSGHVK